MHLSNILLTLCLSTSVLGRAYAPAKFGTDHQNGTHKACGNRAHAAASISEECTRIRELMLLNSTLNNTTRLSEIATKDNLTTTEVLQLQAAGERANLELQKLTANSSLTASCFAVLQIRKSCSELWALTRLENLAGNATVLDSLATRRNLTSSQVAEIKSAAASAAPEYKKLCDNATLVAECKAYFEARKQGLGQTNAALKAEDPAVAFITAINSPVTSTNAVALAVATSVVANAPTNAAADVGFRYKVLALALFGAAWMPGVL